MVHTEEERRLCRVCRADDPEVYEPVPEGCVRRRNMPAAYCRLPKESTADARVHHAKDFVFRRPQSKSFAFDRHTSKIPCISIDHRRTWPCRAPPLVCIWPSITGCSLRNGLMHLGNIRTAPQNHHCCLAFALKAKEHELLQLMDPPAGISVRITALTSIAVLTSMGACLVSVS